MLLALSLKCILRALLAKSQMQPMEVSQNIAHLTYKSSPDH